MFMFGARIGFFRGNIKELVDDIQTLKPTIFVSVPRLLNRVYDKVCDLIWERTNGTVAMEGCSDSELAAFVARCWLGCPPLRSRSGCLR